MIKIALSQYGIQEIVGKKDNPEVLKYFNIMYLDGAKLKDETSWCSAFVNWCAIKSNLPYSGKLTARSWLKVGTRTDNPEMGDVVVLWRESVNSWKGHVGIYVRQTDRHIFILGGNQANKVCIRAYHKNKLLGYRKL